MMNCYWLKDIKEDEISVILSLCKYAGKKPNGLDFRDQPASRKPVFFSCLVNSVDINLLFDTALTK